MKNLIPDIYKNCIGIYCIHNNMNGKNYIGKTEEGFQKRFNRHNSLLNNNKHFNKHLQAAFNKYKSENFTFYVVYVLQQYEDIDDCERGFIFAYRQLGECYNILSGGEGMSGTNNPFFGHKHSDEFKKLQSEKQKANENNKGKNNYFYGKNHFGENNGFYGKHHFEKSKLSMSETKKRMAKEDPKFRQALAEKSKLGAAARARKIICDETKEVFCSVREAQRKYGKGLGAACRNNKPYKNLHFRFL